MSLTKNQVKHVAQLANLPLTSEEEEKYSAQISNILKYVKQLNEVDTSNVKPTFNVSGQENVMSEDKLDTCLPQEEILVNAPKISGDFFVTKGIFNE